MRKHKKSVRIKRKKDYHKIIMLILIILLLFLASIGIYMNYKNSQKQSEIYEIVKENLDRIKTDSASITGDFSTIDIRKWAEQQSNAAKTNFNTATNDINKLVGQIAYGRIPRCNNIIDSNSGAHDILFIGDGYDPTNDAKELMNFEGKGKYSGLFTIEPFKSYKNKFDIRGINYNVGTSNIESSEKRGDTTGASWYKFISMITAAKVGERACSETDYVVVLSRKSFRSICIPGLACLVSLGSDGVSSTDGLLLTHEFAHGFGGLADEYTSSSDIEDLRDLNRITSRLGIETGDELKIFNSFGINSPPNCQASYRTGWVIGCGSSYSNYKPTSASIMNNHRYSQEFNAESKARLDYLLRYSDYHVLKKSSILAVVSPKPVK